MNALPPPTLSPTVTGDIDALLIWFFPIRVRGRVYETLSPFAHDFIAGDMDHVLDMRELVGKDEREIRATLLARLVRFALEVLVKPPSEEFLLKDVSFDELMAIYCQYAKAYQQKTQAVFGGVIPSGGSSSTPPNPAAPAAKPKPSRRPATTPNRGPLGGEIRDGSNDQVLRINPKVIPGDDPPTKAQIEESVRDALDGKQTVLPGNAGAVGVGPEHPFDHDPDLLTIDEDSAAEEAGPSIVVHSCPACDGRMVGADESRLECMHCGKVVTA